LVVALLHRPAVLLLALTDTGGVAVEDLIGPEPSPRGDTDDAVGVVFGRDGAGDMGAVPVAVALGFPHTGLPASDGEVGWLAIPVSSTATSASIPSPQ
jgi:hypothetical protein